MKHIFKNISFATLSLCVSTMFMWSCASDDGNYSYSELNTPELGGLNSDYTAEQFETFTITPDIKAPQGFNPDNYDYVWYMWNESLSMPDTLSTDFALNAPVNVSPGSYFLAYSVTEKATGVTTSKKMRLNVVNSNTSGLVILSDVAGEAQVTFINTKGKVSDDVYKTVNGESLGEGPVGVFLLGNGDNVLPMVAISTKDKTVLTSAIDFSYNMPLSDIASFLSEPGVMTYTSPIKEDESYEYIVVDGLLRQRDLAWADIPVPSFSYNAMETYGVKVAPFLFTMPWEQPFYYDQNNQQFCNFYYGEDYMPVEGDPDSPYFDLSNVGGEMIAGWSLENGDDYAMRAVMRDDEGNLFAIGARMYTESWEDYMQATQRVDIDKNATHFAMSNVAPDFLFYTIGSKIYCVSTITGINYSTTDMGQNIDYIEFDRLDPTVLYVAVSNGSGAAKSGSVIVMEASSTGELTETARYANCCGKVVDFEVK